MPLQAAMKAVPLAADVEHPVEVLYEDDDLVAGGCRMPNTDAQYKRPSTFSPSSLLVCYLPCKYSQQQPVVVT